VRSCVADVNNDGHLDLFGANYGKTGLFLSRGLGRFADSTLDWKADVAGSFDSCAFADFDNDGRLDLYLNGTITGGTSYRDYLFQNSGKTFVDVTPTTSSGRTGVGGRISTTMATRTWRLRDTAVPKICLLMQICSAPAMLDSFACWLSMQWTASWPARVRLYAASGRRTCSA
jgi:hypothetical protein